LGGAGLGGGKAQGNAGKQGLGAGEKTVQTVHLCSQTAVRITDFIELNNTALKSFGDSGFYSRRKTVSCRGMFENIKAQLSAAGEKLVHLRRFL
jgi:hypothetical protein